MQGGADNDGQEEDGEWQNEGKEEHKEDEEQRELEEELANKIEEMRLMPFRKRPQLYKREKKPPRSAGLKDINTMSFAVALLIQEKVTGKHRQEKNKPGSTDKDHVPPWKGKQREQLRKETGQMQQIIHRKRSSKARERESEQERESEIETESVRERE